MNTVSEADGNKGQSDIDIGVALIWKGEVGIEEQGIEEQEGPHIKPKEKKAWDEELEVDLVLIHIFIIQHTIASIHNQINI